MLTKQDIEQIRTVIREEIENEIHAVKDELSSDITYSQMRISTGLDELKNRVKNLEIRITKMHRDLKEEVKMVSHFLDKENIKTLKRVKKVEEHLGLVSN